MKIQSIAQLAIRVTVATCSAGLLLLAAGCSSTSVASNSDAGDRVEVKFPDPKDTWLKQGTFVNVEQLRRVGRGMSEDQVRALIGPPHFNEGFFHPRVWNYLFNFRTGAGDAYITCQWQVIYSKDMLSDAFFWRDAECANLLKPQVVEVARPAPPPPVAVAPVPERVIVPGPVRVPERLRLSADAMFQFNQAGAQDILPAGRDQLDQLVKQLTTAYSRIDLVTVIGHTDNLGSDAYNQELSTRRAQTVREYLVSKGLPQVSLRSLGVGESQPVKECSSKLPRAELISCLQPNRRVEIEILGEKR